MKLFIAIGIIAVYFAGCSSTPQSQSNANLLPALRPYVQEVANELGMVSAERRVMLDAIATNVASQLRSGKEAQLTFICTSNSRRSHMSQIWAQTAAYYYGLNDVHAFSGGTQATACNCRTVAVMRRVGFTIEDATTGDNPVYLVRYAQDRPPIRAYSKRYNADANPKRDFIALMTCSVADKTCPLVEGAISRYAIHYADPRVCDDTPTETTAYNERCREIAREMFYIMSVTRRQLDAVKITSRLQPRSSLQAESVQVR
ncbi:low molecular weight phosphatase family protein [Pedosphaera parvula]|nr:protein-tyrosine-phosphatase [Pedosphaera parvula]